MGHLNDTQSIIDEIGARATAMQDTASNPANNVWVGASAGTGKTKVLTDRILRLLLPPPGDAVTGVDPLRILGITFTKAGASEMIARITKTLSEWAVCDKKLLQQKLDKLLGYNHSLNQYNSARQLFASVIDMSDGMNITTIHAFCQSLLGRFPLEAELSPQFQLIEEAESRALIRQARNQFILAVENGTEDNETCAAFERLARWKNGDAINTLIGKILSDREKLTSLHEQYGSTDAIIDAVYNTLKVDKTATREACLKMFFEGLSTRQQETDILITALSNGAAKAQEKGANLKLFLSQSLDDQIATYETYSRLFLTAEGKPQADGNLLKKAFDSDEAARPIFYDEADRIIQLNEQLKSIDTAQSSVSLILISFKILNYYNKLKKENNVLDYDDLIIKSRDLLYAKTQSGRMMTDWILYKIDGGIDHILVDEAQDTNPIQWQIIEKLAEEFFDGESAREHNPDRSIFIVGDEKQSIFRFQGAQPDKFNIVRHRISNRVEAAQKNWIKVPMDTSFRSTDAVLTLTDAIFNKDELRSAVTQATNATIKHEAFRYGQAGRIELWPLYKSQKGEEREPWALPVTVIEGQNARAALATRLAAQIRYWIDNGEELIARGRPIRPSDIMILVRSRNSMVDHLISALKSENIPVSGVDRMVVSDQIAVQDIMAALSFAMMPDDDLTFACLLKSPFIGWTDETLENYAYGRGNQSLWSAVKNGADKGTTHWLRTLIETLSTLPVFDAITNLLVSPTPSGQTGWQAITARLGIEAIDAVEELLNMAQRYDLNHAPLSIQGFINLINTDKRDLKRELESGGNMVRIMTVHASKGLQSPIVIMPDTTGMPKAAGRSEDGFLWTEGGLPLWAKDADSANRLYNDYKDTLKQDDLDEYHRLLYVALTRAEDRLIVCGTLNGNQKSPNDQSWYNSVYNGLSSIDSQTLIEPWPHDEAYLQDAIGDRIIYETPQIAPTRTDGVTENLALKAAPLPQWATQPMADEHHPPKTLAPSKSDETDVPVRSPLTSRDDSYRFRRGLLTHSLLQYLPNIDAVHRGEAAAKFMNRQAPDCTDELQKNIIDECLAILNDEKFAPFFAEGSLAEAPLTGTITNPKTGKTDIVSGEIDRMVIGDDTVWIVDYKSNRPPPIDHNNVQKQYIKQLYLYKELISKMYPDHQIRTALLWTDGPRMMEINIDENMI